jgi:hypothetical protein
MSISNVKIILIMCSKVRLRKVLIQIQKGSEMIAQYVAVNLVFNCF